MQSFEQKKNALVQSSGSLLQENEINILTSETDLQQYLNKRVQVTGRLRSFKSGWVIFTDFNSFDIVGYPPGLDGESDHAHLSGILEFVESRVIPKDAYEGAPLQGSGWSPGSLSSEHYTLREVTLISME